MKVTIVTDLAGRITGMVRSTGAESKEAPAEVRIVPSPNQIVHEIELPAELDRIESPMQLYSILERNYAVDTRTAALARTTHEDAN
jgi:hypothetical protein